MRNLCRRAACERGLTLIEQLGTILVIAILGAIAIPAFLTFGHRAVDASAKTMAYDAQIAAETYATGHAGGYAGITATALQTTDPSIPITGPGVYLASANGTATGYVLTTTSGYAVTATAVSARQAFTITDNRGTVTRTCLPAVGSSGGCINGAW